MKNWYALSAKAAQLETEVTIFDEIGGFGVSADQFIADLQKIPADHKILLRIHSPGGEVFDGNAIATALSRRGNVEVQIEGIAASMATLISLSGKPVKMAENGFYMIHNPWGAAMGDAEELRKQAELLDRIRGNMVNAYSAKTGQSPEQIGEWMDAETWFTAEQALQAGFVDEVTDRSGGLAAAHVLDREGRADDGAAVVGQRQDAQALARDAKPVQGVGDGGCVQALEQGHPFQVLRVALRVALRVLLRVHGAASTRMASNSWSCITSSTERPARTAWTMQSCRRAMRSARSSTASMRSCGTKTVPQRSAIR